jgi:hypothetical protein
MAIGIECDRRAGRPVTHSGIMPARFQVDNIKGLIPNFNRFNRLIPDFVGLRRFTLDFENLKG